MAAGDGTEVVRSPLKSAPGDDISYAFNLVEEKAPCRRSV
jgi:hypothetical protein